MKYLTLFCLLIACATFATPAHAQNAWVQRALERSATQRTERWDRIQAMLQRRDVRAAQRMGIDASAQDDETVPQESAQSPISQPVYSRRSITQPALSSPTKSAIRPNQTFVPTSPLPSLDATSKFLLLGSKASVIATVKLNPHDEPVEIRSLRIALTAPASSLASLEVADEFGYSLGTATVHYAEAADGSVYVLNLSPERSYYIEKDAQVAFTIRARIKADTSGGESGQSITVATVTPTATGHWTSRTNVITTTGPDFQAHVTSLAVFTSVKNAGQESGIFTAGTEKQLADFTFTAQSVSSSYMEPALQNITFSINTSSDVTVSNATLRDTNAGLSHSCTVASTTITCSGIPATIGALGSPRTLSMYATVTTSGGSNPFVQVNINQPGGPSFAGDITWTDGDSTFTWVPFHAPIVTGTSWQ